MRRQPVIGITPALDEAVKLPASEATHYLRRNYTDVVGRVGAVPLILNVDMSIESVIGLCDGIIISGGEDINPSYYGEDLLKVPGAIREPNGRVDWERLLIDACDKNDVPILGVCYGMQLLNIHYGGTLYQDISLELPDSIGHVLTEHTVTFHKAFLGYEAGMIRTVASRHHQAVDSLGHGFHVTASAPDGIVEAFESNRHFGMQWHPESDETGVHVYRAFVERCLPELVL